MDCVGAKAAHATGGLIAEALWRRNPTALVGHMTAIPEPNRVMLNSGLAGVLTSAHVNPIRSSSATSLLGLDALPPDRKKNRSIWVRSVPPFPTPAIVAAGGE